MQNKFATMGLELFQAFFCRENGMKSVIAGLISLFFVILNCLAMEQIALKVIGALTEVKSTYHTTYIGLLQDNQVIEIDVCTKQRQTRNASPYDLHYSGKIGKRRLTRAQASQLVKKLVEAKQITYLHPAVLRLAKKENSYYA